MLDLAGRPADHLVGDGVASPAVAARGDDALAVAVCAANEPAVRVVTAELRAVNATFAVAVVACEGERAVRGLDIGGSPVLQGVYVPEYLASVNQGKEYLARKNGYRKCQQIWIAASWSPVALRQIYLAIWEASALKILPLSAEQIIKAFGGSRPLFPASRVGGSTQCHPRTAKRTSFPRDSGPRWHGSRRPQAIPGTSRWKSWNWHTHPSPAPVAMTGDGGLG